MAFARTLSTKSAATANTKLDFVTLRIFPFRKTTTAFLHELRALSPKKLRLANIEITKSDEWARRQREKGLVRRMLGVVSEPRWKFYVKEGRTYTMKTGVPGVWEEVATRIREQTVAENEGKGQTKTVVRRPIVVAQKPVVPVVKERLRRQTARTPGR
jgi:hypothetical protein